MIIAFHLFSRYRTTFAAAGGVRWLQNVPKIHLQPSYALDPSKGACSILQMRDKRKGKGKSEGSTYWGREER